MHRDIRRRWRTPDELARADVRDVADALRRLGFQNRRAATLVAMAKAWTEGPPDTSDDVLRLPGCGRYAADSWAIFVEGKVVVDPSDHKLAWHQRRTRGRQG